MRSFPTSGRLPTMMAAAAIAALATTGVAAPSVSAQPRISPSQCAAVAAQDSQTDGYTVTDPATNTSCVTNDDGTWMQLTGAVIKAGQSVKVVASITPTRGDARNKARVYFIRGSKLIKRLVPIRFGLVKFKQKLKQPGLWAIVITYRGQTLSAVVKVKKK